MSQDVLDSPAPASETTPPPEVATEPVAAPKPIESPPLAAQPPRESEPDPRSRLHQLATELMRTRNRHLLVEFLQLRRALR